MAIDPPVGVIVSVGGAIQMPVVKLLQVRCCPPVLIFTTVTTVCAPSLSTEI